MLMVPPAEMNPMGCSLARFYATKSRYLRLTPREFLLSPLVVFVRSHRMLLLALSDTATISIVGILVSGVVGPGFAAHWARRRQRDDHRRDHAEKEHDDLTALLDSAAAMLAGGVTRLRKARSGEGSGLEAWASEVHATYERLLLRVAVDDPVAISYKEARDRLTDLADVFAAEGEGEGVDAATATFEEARTAYLGRARTCLASKAPVR